MELKFNSEVAVAARLSPPLHPRPVGPDREHAVVATPPPIALGEGEANGGSDEADNEAGNEIGDDVGDEVGDKAGNTAGDNAGNAGQRRRSRRKWFARHANAGAAG